MTSNMEIRLDVLTRTYEELLALAKSFGFNTIEEAIRAHDKPKEGEGNDLHQDRGSRPV